MSCHGFGVGGGKEKSVKVEFVRWKNPPWKEWTRSCLLIVPKTWNVTIKEQFSYQVGSAGTGDGALLSEPKKKKNAVAWVFERNIPTERTPLVVEVSANFCG
jgi:hypothetical protein